MSRASAKAHANVALVKYFGKRDAALNLPASSSLSLTLAPLETVTTIKLDPSLDRDEVSLGARIADDKFRNRVAGFLDIVRATAKGKEFAKVETANNFPTAAGLASSASGFAALAAAASKGFGLDLDEPELSALARRGSGSASRSIPGGVVIWRKGNLQNGSDSFAESIAPAEYWDLRILVGVTDPGPKAIGSTEAMELTRKTSPYYADWIRDADLAVEEAREAVDRRDIRKLGEIAEHSALAMHAAAMAAKPGIVFFNGATVDTLREIRGMRAEGLAAYFTCDAGPQPKVLCEAKDADAVETRLKAMPQIQHVIHCRLGEGAKLIED